MKRYMYFERGVVLVTVGWLSLFVNSIDEMSKLFNFICKFSFLCVSLLPHIPNHITHKTSLSSLSCFIQFTRDALIVLAGSKAKGRDFVYFSEVKNIPNTDLATMERLWTKFSGGKFGYSVQKVSYYTFIVLFVMMMMSMSILNNHTFLIAQSK